MTNPEPWEQLAEELTSEMLRMAHGDTDILSDGNRFVQFKQGGDRLDAEAVSNQWLPSDQRLSADDEARLEAFGWHHPEPSLGFDNWRYSEEWPLRSATARGLAQRLVSTLRDILKVDGPQVLEAQRFNAFEWEARAGHHRRCHASRLDPSKIVLPIPAPFREVCMPSADKARRWQNILTELRPRLPGDWAIRGVGLDMVLTREPVDWALAWIGYSDSGTRAEGWVSVGVQPLVVPFTSWVMTYGIRVDEVRAVPRTIDLLSDDVGEQVRQFVLGVGLEKIESWPAQRLADVAEREFAQDPPRRRTHWHHLPGWRVINSTASPVEPAEQLVALCRERAEGTSGKSAQQLLEQAAFHERLRDVWSDSGRDAAVQFLEKRRDQDLATQNLDTVPVAHAFVGSDDR